jgi:hypothetical protein
MHVCVFDFGCFFNIYNLCLSLILPLSPSFLPFRGICNTSQFIYFFTRLLSTFSFLSQSLQHVVVAMVQAVQRVVSMDSEENAVMGIMILIDMYKHFSSLLVAEATQFFNHILNQFRELEKSMAHVFSDEVRPAVRSWSNTPDHFRLRCLVHFYARHTQQSYLQWSCFLMCALWWTTGEGVHLCV